jgi:predicted phosphoribosyltransferase
MHQQRPRPAVTERPFRDRRDAGRVLAERLRHYASRDDVVRDLRIPPLAIERVAQRETRELARRERVSRDSRRMTDLTGKVVILVDDGLATGSGMRAAIQALRELGPARIVVAVPAAPESTCRELGFEADEVVCATTPSPFYAVGEAYWDFTQTDDEVRRLLSSSSPSGSVHLAHPAQGRRRADRA